MEIIIILIIIIWITFFFFYNKSPNDIDESWDLPLELPFKRKDFLLNVPERKFFENIQKIIPNHYVVFPQILLSNIVSVDSEKQDFWANQNKINRKTIDFIIFEKQYLKPILAIEYDWGTHKLESRKQRDDFVDDVLGKCGIKCIHVKHKDTTNFDDINREILEHFTLKL